MSKLTKIEDDAMFDAMIEASNDKLVIMDVHQDWCGVCDALQPTLQRVFQDYEKAEDRMTLTSCSIGRFGAKLQSSFPSDCHVVLEKNGCLPVFALYRFKSCVSVITGVDAPSLLAQISANIPDKPVAE